MSYGRGSIKTYFSNLSVFNEKIEVKFRLIYGIFSFVFSSWVVNDLRSYIQNVFISAVQ